MSRPGAAPCHRCGVPHLYSEMDRVKMKGRAVKVWVCKPCREVWRRLGRC